MAPVLSNSNSNRPRLVEAIRAELVRQSSLDSVDAPYVQADPRSEQVLVDGTVDIEALAHAVLGSLGD